MLYSKVYISCKLLSITGQEQHPSPQDREQQCKIQLVVRSDCQWGCSFCSQAIGQNQSMCQQTVLWPVFSAQLQVTRRKLHLVHTSYGTGKEHNKSSGLVSAWIHFVACQDGQPKDRFVLPRSSLKINLDQNIYVTCSLMSTWRL